MSEKFADLGGNQTPDVLEWRRSLRSPSPTADLRSSRSMDGGPRSLRSRTPSPLRSKTVRGRKLRSRSPSPNFNSKGAYLIDVPSKSTMKRSSVANGLRKSTGSSLTADLSMSGKLNKTTTELASIEAEYIKNLQQQIYFLELESNYLREQARKATDMHPQMTAEAEKMLAKLRAMQSEIDKMDVELKRKDSSIGVHTNEKRKLDELLLLEKEGRQRDKRLLTEELVTLKKEKDRLERELSRKDEQVVEAKSELDSSALALKNADTKISTLKAQLEQRIEQHNLTQLALEEKRSELLSVEAQLRDTEERYVASTVTIQDKLTQDLRDEIRLLHQKVKESELGAEKDRFLRDKISDDMANLVQENAALSQAKLEIARQLEREKELRDNTSHRHSQTLQEVTSLKEKLQENDFLRDQLRQEQEKSRQYLEQLTSQESSSKTVELSFNTAKSRMVELEGMRSAVEAENAQLRKDKTLLVDHVADLQRKMEDKDREILDLKSSISDLEARLRNSDLQKSLEMTQQSQRWEEFSRLADSMKNLSHTMMTQASAASNSPRLTTPQQY
ncbi:paramyosin-like isoform x2 [Plakobranchus ocellatus]|uniref:Paramyosin-like isoform x2 n=1 Tax=Plakobranchus ocellatus TaxID=259542 RepID=A0AAV4C3T6_9GAST|nr:paramyosin-like isoform x2 [Plakobranchus ocellatus]